MSHAHYHSVLHSSYKYHTNQKETIFHSFDLNTCQPWRGQRISSSRHRYCFLQKQIELKVYVNLISYGFWMEGALVVLLEVVALLAVAVPALIGIHSIFMPIRNVAVFVVIAVAVFSYVWQCTHSVNTTIRVAYSSFLISCSSSSSAQFTIMSIYYKKFMLLLWIKATNCSIIINEANGNATPSTREQPHTALFMRYYCLRSHIHRIAFTCARVINIICNISWTGISFRFIFKYMKLCPVVSFYLPHLVVGGIWEYVSKSLPRRRFDRKKPKTSCWRLLSLADKFVCRPMYKTWISDAVVKQFKFFFSSNYSAATGYGTVVLK